MANLGTAGKPVVVAKRFCEKTLSGVWPTRCQTELLRAQDNQWQIDSPRAYCARCGASTGPGSTTSKGCSFCVSTPIPWARIVRLSAYGEPISRWVTSMKFGGGWSWATWFGRELAGVIDGIASDRQVAVCPVPMHWVRRVRRGYNQAQLMAVALARGRGWPMVQLLRRTRYTPPQITVVPSQRTVNVRRSFAIKPVDLTGWEIWLVDDVKTTGATLSACARLLHRAGADRVTAAVAAVADPPSAVNPRSSAGGLR